MVLLNIKSIFYAEMEKDINMHGEFLISLEYWAQTDQHRQVALFHCANIDRSELPHIGDMIDVHHSGRKRNHKVKVTKIVFDHNKELYKVFLDYTHNHKYSLSYVCTPSHVDADTKAELHRTGDLKHWIDNLTN